MKWYFGANAFVVLVAGDWLFPWALLFSSQLNGDLRNKLIGGSPNGGDVETGDVL